MAIKIIRAIDGWLCRFAVRVLAIYQRIFSVFFFGRCRFHPTCSEYARIVFKRFSFFSACRLTIWRLLRCHPFCPGGEDPPPGDCRRQR